VGASAIEQEVPNPQVYEQTLAKEQRPKREVQKTEKVLEQPKKKPRKPREAREPKPRKTMEAEIADVRGHRTHRGKLYFQVKWSHLNEAQNKKFEWVPYEDVAFPQPDGSELVNDKALRYMRRMKLTRPS
jgi:predicted metalloendopeptidase